MGIAIICPSCGELVMTYDERGSMPIKCRCKSCKLLVTYLPKEKKTVLGRVPDRDSASGVRFW